jgi:hypothetical protein
MVERQVESLRLAGKQGLAGAAAYFGFEAAAAKGAEHAVIGEEKGFGALFLGAGAFDAGNKPEGKARTSPQFTDDLLKKVDHKRATGSRVES